MDNLTMCRLCLSQNVRMYSIENTLLQETYETLTNIQLVSDRSSRMACYMCYCLLQKSHRLQQQCITANNVLEQLLHECRVKVTKHTPQRTYIEPYKWTHRLEQSQVEIIYSTALKEMNSGILKSIKKEETIESENTLSDAVGGIATETCDQQRIIITFGDSKENEQINTTDKLSENYEIQNVQEIKYNDGIPSTKRLELQETCEHQCQDIGNETFDANNLSDISQAPNTIVSLEKNKRQSIEPVDHITNKTINNEIKDSESMLEIINRETSDCETLLNEHDSGKESLKTTYYNCDNCTYRSVTKFSLENHIISHDENRRSSFNISAGDKPFVCNICTYKCATRSNLNRHLLRHSGDKPFACTICTYKSITNSDLKRHLRTHSGDKPFACNICTYKCTTKSGLNIHLLTHSGYKPFACNICTYKCTTKSNLNKHLSTHSGDKPFSCHICAFKFRQKSNLNKHLIIHSGVKPFSCKICSYKCTINRDLKKHLLTHSSDKPFACENCSYKCTQKIYLKKHLLTH